ncbi:MAG: HD domain-containing protein [Coriobacteriales bacterium]|nr:HD domain-containing protein [Coriobacteriales bacterium]
MLIYYTLMFVMSGLLMLAYLAIWHKHLDMHITLIFVLVPTSNLGYLLVAKAQTLEAALVATKMSYIGGCYLLPILMLAVFGLCDIQVRRAVRMVPLCLSTVLFLAILTIGWSPVYYQSVLLEHADGVSFLVKQYGPWHTAFIVVMISYICATFAALIYSYLHKNQVSRKNLALLMLTEVVASICFFAGRRALPSVEFLPISYNFALAVYLVIASRISLYDIADSSIDSLLKTGETGFASVDFKWNYLGSNNAAKLVFPQFAELTVDKPLAANEYMAYTVLPWLKEFASDHTQNEFLYEQGEDTYKIGVQDLYSGRRKRGYQLVITNDTKSQRYIRLLNTFNTQLQTEVEKKTTHIVEMHDNLVLSMATMVESRDNSTGGHIRRTSEGVRLIVEQMQEANDARLTYSFCRNVVKAAPMHDLGKIAVDDAILRKPGRFTPEEFQKMQAHAAEGARIVHEILKGTDDDEFRQLAENVAHYHHERWDGSGYPEGLAGEQIPLEARIMAIADVYDALVSKRVYKEAMPFDQADAIIMEGMGSQFDAGLEPFYVRARPLLEQYYAAQ